jgi:zinc finger BED domain-containing protein 1 (E3 SUMO-protein ligase ZBED1)
VKAVKDIAKLRHVPCFAHTLHLVVSQAVDANSELKDLLLRSKIIVSYFKKSSTASSKLRHLCPGTQKKLKQEVPTRWNSWLAMAKSLVDDLTEKRVLNRLLAWNH